MNPRSAKQKGRSFQQAIRDLFLRFSNGLLEKDDVRSTSMGAGGEDILFSPAARRMYPYSVECKNTERLNIWKAIEQAKENAAGYIPMVAFRKNHHEAWIAVPADKFMELVHGNTRGEGSDAEDK